MQPTPRFPRNDYQSESEEEPQSSDTDSDSEPSLKQKKRPKIKLKPKSRRTTAPKEKKYDVWSTRVQEDFLAETLNSCDVTSKDRSRNVESYDYTLAYKLYNKDKPESKPFVDQRRGNKRTVDDRRNSHFRQRRRSSSSDKEKKKGKPRIILDLAVGTDDSPDEIAKDIGNKLYEEKEDLILKVVQNLGKKRTFEIFKETKKIEEDGGMLIMNQTRRRTPGGVFLYLVRNDYHITPEQKRNIFGEDRKKNNRAAKERQKEMLKKVKMQNEAAKANLLPDLLSRGDLFAAKDGASHRLKETDENDSGFNNPPPTPETDANENSNDGVDASPSASLAEHVVHEMEDKRGKLNSYDDDFLDISGSAEMDLF
ncbi:unnamed protein product [Acanthoscelides obtectus]|nr:unnamed protein product [Acanthoscelides obtectus]CAK1657840.1 Phosphorylated adapter RNA export protein [Acanthoscelides obtectus]